MRDGYGRSHSGSAANMDSIFAEFTADGEENPGRNEAGEALEGLGLVGVSQDDDEAGRRLSEEFLN